MRALVFDTGSLISLVTNNLLWILRPLKKQFRGDFLISESVKEEIIDHPLKTKKFKLEGLMVQDLFREGVFALAKNKHSQDKINEILDLANNCFLAKNHPIKIVDKAEIETLTIVLQHKAQAMIIDERTLRLLIEDPEKLEKVLEIRSNEKVEMNKENIAKFKEITKDIKVFRSTELAYIAYKLGILDKYITAKKITDKKLKRELLEGTLWALKLKGCSISEQYKELFLKALHEGRGIKNTCWEQIHEQFSWDKAVDKMIEVMQEMGLEVEYRDSSVEAKVIEEISKPKKKTPTKKATKKSPKRKEGSKKTKEKKNGSGKTNG